MINLSFVLITIVRECEFMINIFNWVINDAVNCVTVVWLHRTRSRFVYWVTNIADGNRKADKSLPLKNTGIFKVLF